MGFGSDRAAGEQGRGEEFPDGVALRPGLVDGNKAFSRQPQGFQGQAIGRQGAFLARNSVPTSIKTMPRIIAVTARASPASPRRK